MLLRSKAARSLAKALEAAAEHGNDELARRILVVLARLGLDASEATADKNFPSGDVLFASLAKHIGSGAIGMVLTGMGNDGSVGLKKISERGGSAIVQSADSAVVNGMPLSAASAVPKARNVSRLALAEALSVAARRVHRNVGARR